MPLPAPTRSCIKLHNHNCDLTCENELNDSENKIESTTSSRSKKRVVFADEEGLELEHVKIMSEQSNQPPVWSLEFLAHVTQGMISPVPQQQWTIDFRQPASDYLEFRRKLETINVSLENVIIKESESTVVGTVKVKNLSFHKEVFIRSSWDDWKSQVDTFCTYSQIVGASCAYVIYDTFSFKLTLPPNSRSLEFCVGFRVDGKEYWDNNQGANYKLTNRVSVRQEEREFLITRHNAKVDNNNKENAERNENHTLSTPIDVPKPKYGTWSEFSSRTETLLPYCSVTLKDGHECEGLLI
jgi:protein phosphatase 1 regulatory subunit 3A/B/C/D/E